MELHGYRVKELNEIFLRLGFGIDNQYRSYHATSPWKNGRMHALWYGGESKFAHAEMHYDYELWKPQHKTDQYIEPKEFHKNKFLPIAEELYSAAVRRLEQIVGFDSKSESLVHISDNVNIGELKRLLRALNFSLDIVNDAYVGKRDAGTITLRVMAVEGYGRRELYIEGRKGGVCELDFAFQALASLDMLGAMRDGLKGNMLYREYARKMMVKTEVVPARVQPRQQVKEAVVIRPPEIRRIVRRHDMRRAPVSIDPMLGMTWIFLTDMIPKSQRCMYPPLMAMAKNALGIARNDSRGGVPKPYKIADTCRKVAGELKADAEDLARRKPNEFTIRDGVVERTTSRWITIDAGGTRIKRGIAKELMGRVAVGKKIRFLERSGNIVDLMDEK